ncbi:YggL family protein [Parasalinivibrio latis]|uniref:YggL 50S ribosome-binding family protein n=1 Tax=Parasalinivibrio latis TaxID=2952610 RepID=UPI0030E16F37
MNNKIKFDSLKNKSRRLRKKLYLGEFAVTGFELHFAVPTSDAKGYDQLLEELINQVESRNLCIGGGADSQGKVSFFVAPFASYGKATEEDRTALINWLETQSQVASVEAGPLVDANYGPY